MRRRFGRRRGRGTRDGGAAPIDAARWLQRIIDEGIVAASRLEPFAGTGIPDDFAAVGSGEAQDGTPLIVGFAPQSGGDAALAAVAAAAEQAAGDGFSGEVIAISPQWSTASRQRLGLLRELPFRFRALAASNLAEGDLSVEPEPFDESVVLSASQVAAHLTRPADRALFDRAAAALEGLASKHGGAVRGVGRSLELVVLAKRSAELRADDSGVILTTLLPQRDTARLAADGLAEALDRLEGNLRRRLNDRKTRDGEDGLRARAVPVIAETRELRQTVPWPLGGSDSEALDLAGVDAENRPVLAAVRKSFGLPDLAATLDALVRLKRSLAALLSRTDAPLLLDSPRILLAAESFEPSVARVLPHLVVAHELLELREVRGRGLTAESIGAGDAATKTAPTRARRPQPARDAEPARAESDGAQAAEAPAAEGGPSRRGGRRRGGRGRGARSDSERAGAQSANDGDATEARGAEASTRDSSAAKSGATTEGRSGGRFEEVSLFDLDEERGDEDGGGARRRRGRGRGRRRRGNGAGATGDREAGDTTEASGDRDGAADTETSPPGRERSGRGRGRGRGAGSRTAQSGGEAEKRPASSGSNDDPDGDDDDADALLELSDADVPDLTEVEEPRYEEDEDEEADPEVDRLALEREKRRRVRAAKSEAEPQPKPKPRRRAAIVAHADVDSIFAAVLLARDIRLLEGFWIYPQEELMTFFRSVATDLRDEAPIFVVGFEPRPARDVIQAASLYGERLVWFDHHEWPPEDRDGLKQALGEEALNLSPGAGTSLPAVLATSNRRSRFSDKLVDLRTGRFSQHDYERWGRVWWRRLLELADKPGERRAEIEPLLAGRPSDLAKEAARIETPAPPDEIQFVSSHDFRVVHFSGHVLVVVEVPDGVEMHLAARIARERYGASLSLARRTGEELVVLAGDELPGRKSLDFGGLIDHLANKLQWVESLADEDHVARFLIRDVEAKPERLNDVLGEIAMGRSILEG